MYAQPKKEALPIWGWWLTIGLSLLFIAVVLLTNNPGKEKFYTEKQLRAYVFDQRLEHLTQHYPYGDPRIDLNITFIGTSLINQGVDTAGYWEQKFRQEKNLTARVDRLLHAGGGYHVLFKDSLQKHLLRSEPDVLLIEEGMFVYKPLPRLQWPEPWYRRWGRLFVFYINEWKARLLPGIYTSTGFAIPKVRDLSFEGPHPLPDNRMDSSNIDEDLFTSRTTRRLRQTRPFHPILQELVDGGTQVIFIRMPRTDSYESRHMSPREEKRRQKLLDYYRDNYQIEHFVSKQNWPPRYFQDPSHMNRPGQIRYSTELWKYLKAKSYASQGQ